MALSFVTPEDAALLEDVKAHQATEGKDLQPYNFKMTLVDGFRYRVEDVLRTVTSLSVKDARLAEIKSEVREQIQHNTQTIKHKTHKQ